MSLTCKRVGLESCQAREEAEDGHLDQGVFTGFVLQHPSTDLQQNIVMIYACSSTHFWF